MCYRFLVLVLVCVYHLLLLCYHRAHNKKCILLFKSGPEAHGLAYFGQGQGDIYLENVQCNGSESSLEDCPASELGVHNCYHSEDAGVKCQGNGNCMHKKNADIHLELKFKMHFIFHRFMYKWSCGIIDW